MKCMYCKKEIVEKLSFNNVFSKKDSLVLCEECKYNIDINITLSTLGRFMKRKNLVESFDYFLKIFNLTLLQ